MKNLFLQCQSLHYEDYRGILVPIVDAGVEVLSEQCALVKTNGGSQFW